MGVRCFCFLSFFFFLWLRQLPAICRSRFDEARWKVRWKEEMEEVEDDRRFTWAFLRVQKHFSSTVKRGGH